MPLFDFLSSIIGIANIIQQGNEFVSSIKIGIPEKVDELEWKCGVEIYKVDKLRIAHGIDSLQALVCALSLAQSILVNRVKKGWLIFWPDTKRPTSPEEIFGFDFDPSKLI